MMILPVHRHKDEIKHYVSNHRVSFIVGDTGCGKSSQIPLFLLEQPNARILVTQPRRLAAISVARFVASCVNEPLGRTVGYRIGGESESTAQTRLTFVTSGWLGKLLIHQPKTLSYYTHIVIDEAHERSKDGDVLALLLKVLLPKFGPKMRLIIMSATLQDELFEAYFSFPSLPPISPSACATPAKPIRVGVMRYPVKIFYLNDILKSVYLSSYGKKHLSDLRHSFGMDSRVQKDRTVTPDLRDCAINLIVEVAVAVAEGGKAVLVFLPGLSEIISVSDALHTALEDYADQMGNLSIDVCVLHSEIEKKEQENTCKPPPDDVCRVILSTNVAESSLTIPALKTVIDVGMEKEVFYEDFRDIHVLRKVWTSKASAAQRAGRVGRTFPGTVFRLYPREFFEHQMPAFRPSEMTRLSPISFVLSLMGELKQFGTLQQLADQLLDPPPTHTFEHALTTLHKLQCITAPSEEGQLTRFGKLANQLPLDISLSRIVAVGVEANLVCEAVVLASAFSVGDLFPRYSSAYGMGTITERLRKIRRVFDNKHEADAGALSDPIAAVNLFFTAARDGRHPKGVSSKKFYEFTNTIFDVASRMATHLEQCARGVDDDNAQQLYCEAAENLSILAKLSRISAKSRMLWQKYKSQFDDPGGAKRPALRLILALALNNRLMVGETVQDKSVRNYCMEGYSTRDCVMLKHIPDEACYSDLVTYCLNEAKLSPGEPPYFKGYTCLLHYPDDRCTCVDTSTYPPSSPIFTPSQHDILKERNADIVDISPAVKRLLLTGQDGSATFDLPPPHRLRVTERIRRQRRVELGKALALARTSWHLPRPFHLVCFDWRSVVAFSTDVRPWVKHHFAVGSVGTGSGSFTNITMESVTLLPSRGHFGLFTFLLCCDKAIWDEVVVETEEEDGAERVVCVRILSDTISLAHSPLELAHWQNFVLVREQLDAHEFGTLTPGALTPLFRRVIVLAMFYAKKLVENGPTNRHF